MLEIPESYNLAKQLSDTLLDKPVAGVKAGGSPHKFAWFNGDPAGYGALLAGRAFDSAEASAGYVTMRSGSVSLILGEGVNVRYYAPGAAVPPKNQLDVRFADGSALVCTVAMYGGMWAVEGEWDNAYYKVAREKPSPLTDDFDEAYFDSIVANAKKTLSAKALLAAEQRIPGLGNGVLQDILFIARVAPRKKLQALSDTELSALYKSVKNTLADMTEKGGRDTERDLFGNEGGYKTLLSAKTYKNPCPVCGGPITREAYMGGNVYYCGVCQKG